MNIRYVNSLDLEELEVYTKFNEPELLHYYEPKRGAFIAETPDVIARAIAGGCEPISFLLEEKVLQSDAVEIIRQFPDIPVYAAPLDLIGRIVGYHLTRGMLCMMRRPSLPAVEELIDGSRHIVLLEDIENPTNVGALFRSAAALGADGIILTKGCADPLYRRAARVSMGAVFFIPWTKTDSGSLPGQLRDAGFTVISMALADNAVSINDVALDRLPRTAVIFGNEKNGITEGFRRQSDYIVKIPMSHGIDSLNVASAGAVAFYRFFT